MKDDISQIIQSLVLLNRDLSLIFEEGFTDIETKWFLSDLNFHPTGELIDFYSQINGRKYKPGISIDEIQFFPGFYLLNIEDSIEIYRQVSRNPSWNQYWYPLFSNGGGDFYCIQMTEHQQFSSQIIGFILGISAEVEYLSLTTMMATISNCYKSGAYYLDKDGYLEIDDELERKISRQLNPGIHRWE